MSHMISKSVSLLLLLFATVFTAIAVTPATEGTVLYIISPQDGDVVSNPVRVQFGLRGMGVAPAGIDKPKTGHHHLLIDVTAMPMMDKPLPSDDKHRHFGGGQTEVDLTLSPGKHTLQLVLGDMNHVPFSPPIMSEKITISVK
ncbi:MAG: DUF4399 domain-containing protein [Candidatus Thiodiazotropha sp. (ex Monitilora ramsayi)]|nr:DUF4399 domain-containing protein [Candidatus Thiodiazotropha sp. (ex Monitilora ramsayi)]